MRFNLHLILGVLTLSSAIADVEEEKNNTPYVGLRVKSSGNDVMEQDKIESTALSTVVVGDSVQRDLFEREAHEGFHWQGVIPKLCWLVGIESKCRISCQKNPGICHYICAKWPDKHWDFCPTRKPTTSPTAAPSMSPTQEVGACCIVNACTDTCADFILSSACLELGGTPLGLNTFCGVNPCPTLSPTGSPSMSPTASPTETPTASPTNNPTSSPTNSPTRSPSKSPTNNPTSSPSKSPTNNPTPSPTNNPTESPTDMPTSSPTTAQCRCIPYGSNAECTSDSDCCNNNLGVSCHGGRCMCDFVYVSGISSWQGHVDNPPTPANGQVCTLASILNQAEQDQAFTVAQNGGLSGQAWLGAEYVDSSNTARGWRNIDGTDFRERFANTQWRSNQPSGNTGGELKLAWFSNGDWDDGTAVVPLPGVFKCCPACQFVYDQTARTRAGHQANLPSISGQQCRLASIRDLFEQQQAFAVATDDGSSPLGSNVHLGGRLVDLSNSAAINARRGWIWQDFSSFDSDFAGTQWATSEPDTPLGGTGEQNFIGWNTNGEWINVGFTESLPALFKCCTTATGP